MMPEIMDQIHSQLLPFSSQSASYCQNATNPSPTISGTTEGYLVLLVGLEIDSSGIVDLSSSIVGTHTITYITSTGNCADTATFTLTVDTVYNDTIVQTACDSLVWQGTTYTTSGIYTDTLQTLAGCDSILTLDLTINDSYSFNYGTDDGLR